MGAPTLTYKVSHYKRNPETGAAEVETFNGMPTTTLRFSTVNPYNTLTVTYTPDMALSYYEVRATKMSDAWGIGLGTRLYYTNGNIANASSNTFNIVFTTPPFEHGEYYRLSFYAKNATSDGLWDVTYLLISSDNYMICTEDYDGIEVHTDEPIPAS